MTRPVCASRPRRQLSPLLLLGCLCRLSAGLVFVVPPGVVSTECVLQKLTPDMVHGGDAVQPGTFDGRASFFVRHVESEGTTPPLAVVTIKGPSGNSLWERVVGVEFREDAVFRGEGWGDYSLCARNSRSDVPVSVELSYFTPHTGVIDHPNAPRPDGTPAETGAAADDLAGALGYLRRLQGDLRRLRADQDFLQRRQQRHAVTLASSERRAVVWSALEAAVLVALSGAQMLLFRHAFRNY